MVTLSALLVVKSNVKVATVLLKTSGFCEVYVEGRKIATYASLEDCLYGENFIERDSFLCTSQREVEVGRVLN